MELLESELYLFHGITTAFNSYKVTLGNLRKQGRRPPCHRILRGHGAVIHRKMYFAVNASDEHGVQSHMFRPTIVVTATTFTLFKANTKETTKEVAPPCIGLNMVNITAVTTILALHVGNGRSEHV